MTLSVVVIPGVLGVGHGPHDQVTERVVTPASPGPGLLVTEEARCAITVRVNLATDLEEDIQRNVEQGSLKDLHPRSYNICRPSDNDVSSSHRR